MDIEEMEQVLAREGATFEELIEVIEAAADVMKRYRTIRDRALVQADETGPYANRRTMGDAASLYPSSLIRILTRNGRPADRRKGEARSG